MIHRIGIVGAGTMGSGLAQLCAQQGFSVKIHDALPQALAEVPKRIKEGLEREVLKGRLTIQQSERAVQAVSLASQLKDLSGADLVIEAVSEDLALKRKVFGEIQGICPDAILATNTSSLSVAEIASAISTPERVLGMHFFNPPAAMKLVELSRAERTREEVFQAAWDFVLMGLRKTPVYVKDTPGFIVNRVMRPYYLEAQRLAGKGAGISAVDKACRELGGVPMGPFELMDLIGLDVNLAITRNIYEALQRPERLKPCELQEDLVQAGQLGRKAGKGFYLYERAVKEENPKALRLVPPAADMKPEAVWARILRGLVFEAELLYADGAATKTDIDAAVRLAMNFPKGPFQWQKELGSPAKTAG